MYDVNEGPFTFVNRLMTVGNPEKCGKSVEHDQKPVTDKSGFIYNMFLVTLH